MLRSRTATGSQVLQVGQTSPSLQIVSLAGQSGFSRTANVHGFSSSSTATRTAPTRTAYIENGRLQSRTGTQTQTQTQTQLATQPEQTQTRGWTKSGMSNAQLATRTAAGAPAPGDPGGSRTMTFFEKVKKWFRERKERGAAKDIVRRAKSEEKARRKKEKKARKLKEKKEKAERKRQQKVVRTGGGGVLDPGRKSGRSGIDAQVVERKEAEKVTGSSLRNHSAESTPGDPDPGASGTEIVNEKAKKGPIQVKVAEEKEGGCFGCIRLC